MKIAEASEEYRNLSKKFYKIYKIFRNFCFESPEITHLNKKECRLKFVKDNFGFNYVFEIIDYKHIINFLEYIKKFKIEKNLCNELKNLITKFIDKEYSEIFLKFNFKWRGYNSDFDVLLIQFPFKDEFKSLIKVTNHLYKDYFNSLTGLYSSIYILSKELNSKKCNKETVEYNLFISKMYIELFKFLNSKFFKKYYKIKRKYDRVFKQLSPPLFEVFLKYYLQSKIIYK